MPKIICTAQVEDAVKWAEGLPHTRRSLRSQTVTGPIDIAVNDGNEVAVCFDAENLDKFMEIFNSPATAAVRTAGAKIDHSATV